MPIRCPFCQGVNRDSAAFCMKCGQPLGAHPIGAPSAGLGPLSSGTLLDGRYRVERELGGGGMGMVYLAADTRLGDIACAVKEMTDAFSAASERQYVMERFQAEALMLAKLSHPRIPRVTDHFVERGRYYLVMDYIDGENLEGVLAREGCPGLPEPSVVNWGLQILDVLTYLHEQQQPVIFRDLKPANMMRRRADGGVVLVDFGIARLFVPAQAATMIGTPGYTPPEQYQGLAEPRSDLYALAAALHHLLTGRDPRRGTPFTFPPVRSLNAALSPALEAVVTKALSLRVEDRYASAREMSKAIRNSSEPGGVPMSAPGVLGRLPIDHGTLEQVEEIARFEGHQSGVADVAFSPDGRLLASAGSGGEILLWEVSSGRELWRYQHGAPVRCVAFNPDGHALASGGEDGFLRLWEIGGGEIRALDHRSSVFSVGFSADGGIVAVGCENGRVTLLSRPFDRPRQKSLDVRGSVFSLALSGSGFLATGCEQGRVDLWQLANLRHAWNGPGSSAEVFAVAISPDDRLVASGGDDGSVRLLDLGSGHELDGFELESHVESVAFNVDGQVLAAGGHDCQIWLWDFEVPNEIWCLEGHTAVVTRVLFSPDGRLLASASDDGTVRLWGVPNP